VGPKGRRCRAAVPHGHWKTIIFVGGLTLAGVIAPMLIDQPMDGEVFLAWCKQMLAPALRPGDIVVMDNLLAHKVADIKDAIEAGGGNVLQFFVSIDPKSCFSREMGRRKQFDETEAIDDAVDCFWSRGYQATSVRDLALCMGIGGASLYNAYGGKRGLFVKALARYADRSSRERIARLEAGGQPKQAIEAFFAEIIERSLKDRQHKGCLLVNSALDVAPHDAGIGKVVAGYLGEIRDFFRRNIVAAQKACQVPGDLDDAEVSRHLLGVLLGIRVLARTRPDRETLEAVARPALRLLDPPQAEARRSRKSASAPRLVFDTGSTSKSPTGRPRSR